MKFKQKKIFCNNEREKRRARQSESRGFIPYERTQSDAQSVKKNFRKKISDFRTGFTLVELIVSMALFIIVVFITTSAFLTLSTLSKKASTTRIAMDNLSVVIESMTRNIRTGYTYRCSNESDFYTPSTPLIAQDCSGGNTSLSFYNQDGIITGYMFRSGQPTGPNNVILFNQNNTFCKSSTPGKCLRLTAPEIIITNLKFYVTGADNTSGVTNQPHVNIVVQGVAGTDPRTQSKFSIYTSVTQRATR